ncbi:P-loop NTPase family protein [Lederbergia citri]|uniref:Uncharacterized protein n=1 Tax=Lederbergia citri TaxID=2833580 RepID=A0A942THY3_9BACI|nr:hypothetical protein [Lederbergia citri]MBS4196447.1 hypothetical protein [Lederbergia citri]
MQNTIPLYRSIDENLFKKIGYEVEPVMFSHYFEEEERTFTLAEEGEEKPNVYLMNDKEGIWDPNIHDLTIRQRCSLENPGFLFGSSGVATKDSRLGIAVNWYSRSSSMRSIEPLSTIVADEVGPREFDIEVTYKPGQLRGSVVIETVLYLENPGKWSEPGYATKVGTILGVLDSKTLYIDGEGSEFPIVEIEDPAKPLWWVECNWTDPMIDLFDQENVRIYLNLKHRYAKDLNLRKGIAQSPLLIEILASSFQIIINELGQSQDWADIKIGQNVEKGSIGEAIYYFLNTFGWDTSSSEKLARTIREDLYSRFVG